MEFRTRLADGTRAAHDDIERLLALETDAPLERYVAYLRSMHAVVAPFEAAAAHDATLGPLALPARRKRAWLEKDMRFFAVSSLAYSPVVPAQRAARAGWAYVLEGSALGARVLYKRLAPRWSLSPRAGGAFLWGYGERTAEAWRSFVDALNAMPFSEPEAQACIAGAKQAFEAIADAFRASVAGADGGIER